MKITLTLRMRTNGVVRRKELSVIVVYLKIIKVPTAATKEISKVAIGKDL